MHAGVGRIVHVPHALLDDVALQRRILAEVRDDLFEHVGVHDRALHVLRARIFAALDLQDLEAALGQRVGAGVPGRAGPHDDDVEFFNGHHCFSFYSRVAYGGGARPPHPVSLPQGDEGTLSAVSRADCVSRREPLAELQRPFSPWGEGRGEGVFAARQRTGITRPCGYGCWAKCAGGTPWRVRAAGAPRP